MTPLFQCDERPVRDTRGRARSRNRVYTQTVSGATHLAAPGKFLSGSVDYTKLDGKAYISWQHELVLESDVSGEDRYEIRLSGPGGAAKFDAGYPDRTQLNKWFTAAAPLTQADWAVTSGTWSGLLADVEDMEIDISLIENGSLNHDVEAIDNIKLVAVKKGFSPK